MEEIFDRQRELNVHTLRNIGLDFDATMADPEAKPVWIENYRKALSAELAELIREVDEHGIGTQNGKVEVVDMLHFLVSLSIIVGIGPGELPPVSRGGAVNLPSQAIRTFLALDELQNSLKWKWWAKGGGYNPDKAGKAILELWECFHAICALFELDLAAVERIYVAKNRINFERQANGYNEDTKTEADNRSIGV